MVYGPCTGAATGRRRCYIAPASLQLLFLRSELFYFSHFYSLFHSLLYIFIFYSLRSSCLFLVPLLSIVGCCCWCTLLAMGWRTWLKSVLHDYETLEACFVLYIVTVFEGDQIFILHCSAFVFRCFHLISKCNCFVFYSWFSAAFSNITRSTYPLVPSNEAFEIENSHRQFFDKSTWSSACFWLRNGFGGKSKQ